MGIAWIHPGPTARYVAVGQAGYVEVYEPAGSLPVRISTTDVEIEGSRAIFEVSEHDITGRQVRRYELEVVPAG
jgi:hypothetical protein